MTSLADVRLGSYAHCLCTREAIREWDCVLTGKDLHAPEMALSVRFAGLAAFCSSAEGWRLVS